MTLAGTSETSDWDMEQRRMESNLLSQRWHSYITQRLLVNDFRSSERSLEEADAKFERNAMTDKRPWLQ